MNAVAKVPAQPLTTMSESIAAGGGIISIMAAKYHVEPLVLRDTIHNTIFDRKGTEAEFIAFLVVANEYKLNPLTREIYAFPKKGGGIVPVVSIDGWISLVNSHPQFKGMEFEPHTNDKGALYAYTCRIWRKDREMPTAVTEYLDECIRVTEPWKMKNRMLRHKALIQCARYAFGFSGIYDDDEGAVIAETRGGINSAAPPPPPVFDTSEPPAPTATAEPEVEDAVIVSETATAGPSPAEAQAADAPPGPPPVEGVSAAEPDEVGINPDDELANLIDKLAHAKDEATIEEWYAETDIEAALAEFSGYVEKARQVKAAQIDRVQKLAARNAKAETQAEAAAPPPPPALADEDDGEAPPPPPADDAGFDVDGWQALTTQAQYAGYAKLLAAYADKVSDAAIIEKFFNDSAKMRAALFPIATAKPERTAIVEGLNATMAAINKRVQGA